MDRENCYTCNLLKEFYRSKLRDYVLAARSAQWSPLSDPIPINDELYRSRSKTIAASRALLKHWETCKTRERPNIA
jgi:hypothetical protein